jgi:hypothetical protein
MCLWYLSPNVFAIRSIHHALLRVHIHQCKGNDAVRYTSIAEPTLLFRAIRRGGNTNNGSSKTGRADDEQPHSQVYSDTDAVLLCYDAGGRASFEHVRDIWMLKVAHWCPGIPTTLVCLPKQETDATAFGKRGKEAADHVRIKKGGCRESWARKPASTVECLPRQAERRRRSSTS